jgi:hypothetical protein
MKNLLYAALLISVLVGAYAYKEYNRAPETMATAKSDLSVTAAEVYQAFGADEAAANAKYLDKTITMKGKVSSSSTEEGVTSITLFADSETGGVICKLDPLTQHAQTNFAEGEEITLKGICTGYLLDVVVERCVVVK